MMDYQVQILSNIIHLRSQLADTLEQQIVKPKLPLSQATFIPAEARQTMREFEGLIEAQKNKLKMLDEFRF